MPPLFSLTGITKRFGNQTVLALESLSLHPGKVYSLTGPNGAGKSTLLQILAFLTEPTSGELCFKGIPVNDSNAQSSFRQEVTLVHQSPYLFHSTVYANISFGLKAHSIPVASHPKRVAQALAMVGLQDFADRHSRKLSGGEAQRVAIARALAISPTVLLLDEPFSNLDQDGSQLLEELIHILSSQGTTVVISTHDVDRKNRLGTENIHLIAGHMVA